LHPKDTKNELLDILIEIPGILEDFDALLNSAPAFVDERRSSRHSLLERCILYDGELQRWSLGSGLETVSFVEDQIIISPQESAVPSSDDYAMAHLGSLYWTTCLLVYQHLCIIQGHSLDALPERMEPRQYCRKLLLLMPYFQHSNVGEFFPNIAVFPTLAVMRFLNRHDSPGRRSEERKMLGRAFKGDFKLRMENSLRSWL
jgi:hypothetical protein